MRGIDSPSGIDLRPEPPGAVRLSKRAGVLGLAIVTVVIGLIGYGVVTRRQRTVAAIERDDPSRLTAASDAGKAIAAQVPARIIPGAPPVSGSEEELRPPETVTPSGPQVVRPVGYAHPYPPPPPPPVVREPSAEEKARIAAYRQELEALGAPTATRVGGGLGRLEQPGLPSRDNDIAQMTALLQAMQGPRANQAGPDAGGRGIPRLSLDNSSSDSDEYAGQNMFGRREAFLGAGRGEAGRDNYLKSSRLRPLSKYEIKAGWDIPAVLEQALNSDLPGEIRALVRENVYDTATGNFLLVPQGSRLVGVYDSRIAYAQNGVTVSWDRIIFPDGSSINLDGMAGQDAQGQAGLRHDVDNHYRRLIGFAALTSLFSAAFQLSQSRRDGLLAYPSTGEIAGSAVGRELSRLGADVTRRNLNVQPTIKVPVGFRFNVRVNRDLLFEAPYRPIHM